MTRGPAGDAIRRAQRAAARGRPHGHRPLLGTGDPAVDELVRPRGPARPAAGRAASRRRRAAPWRSSIIRCSAVNGGWWSLLETRSREANVSSPMRRPVDLTGSPPPDESSTSCRAILRSWGPPGRRLPRRSCSATCASSMREPWRGGSGTSRGSRSWRRWTGATRNGLHEMRAAIDREAGRRRLLRILMARSFHAADDQQKARLGGELAREVEKPTRSFAAGRARGTGDPARAAGGRARRRRARRPEGQQVRSIARTHGASARPRDAATPLQDRVRGLLEDFETLPVREGFVNRIQQQTIVPGTGGVFTACLRCPARRDGTQTHGRRDPRVVRRLHRIAPRTRRAPPASA